MPDHDRLLRSGDVIYVSFEKMQAISHANC